MAQSTHILDEWIAQQRRESINHKLQRIDCRRRELHKELDQLNEKERELVKLSVEP
jgi:predicted  nucleic acid-binding Zn-ribbon protein